MVADTLRLRVHQNDLADVLARFHQRMGGGGFLQREGAENDGLQLFRPEQRPHIAFECPRDCKSEFSSPGILGCDGGNDRTVGKSLQMPCMDIGCWRVIRVCERA